MPQDQAEVVFSAEDREILRSWKQQHAEVSNLTAAINRLNATFASGSAKSQDAAGRFNARLKEGHSFTQQWQAGASRFASSFAMSFLAVDAAVSRTIGIIRDAKAAYDEFQKASATATLSRSESFTQFRIQAGVGLNQEALAEQYKAIHTKIAADTGTKSTMVDTAAAQMASSGVPTAQIEGGALLALMKGVAIQGAMGQDVSIEDLVKATTMILKANKREVSAANIDALMVAFQGLKEKNIKLVDMIEYAKESGSVAELSRIPMEEQIAVYAQLLEVMPPEAAATGTRTAIRELAAAGNHPSRVKALARIGLKPADVDFYSEPGQEREGTEVVFKRLRQGLDKIPVGKRAAVIDAIFGARGGRVGEFLMRPELGAGLHEDLAKMQDRGNYDRDFALYQKSLAARQKGAEVRKEDALYSPRAADTEFARTELEAQLTSLSNAGTISAYRKGLIESSFSMIKSAGGADETALRGAPAIVNMLDTIGRAGLPEFSTGGLFSAGVPTANFQNSAQAASQQAGNAVASYTQTVPATGQGVNAFRRGGLLSAGVPTPNAGGLLSAGVPVVDLVAAFREVFATPQKLTVESGNVQRPATKTVKGVL